ncbi:MAG: hypothetical protein J1E31_01450 [Helicobacter sp.]|nr:hypothetical protein [Helicobacter sp.]
MSKKAWIVIGCLLLGIAAYFLLAPSYQLSRKAQKAFEVENYEEAYNLAKESLEKDPYNKGAFGIFSQSRQRIEIKRFLDRTKRNYEEAQEILKKSVLTPQEFLQLKWIYETFAKEIETLTFTNSPTPEEAQQIEQFKQWFNSLNAQLTAASSNFFKKDLKP